MNSPRSQSCHHTSGPSLPIVVRYRSLTGIYTSSHYHIIRHNRWDRVVFSDLVVVEEGGDEALWGKEEWP